MIYLPNENKTIRLIRLVEADEFEVAADMNLPVDEDNYLYINEPMLEIFLNLINEKRAEKKAVEDSERLAAWLLQDSQRLAAQLDAYDMVPADESEAYEYAVFDGTAMLQISRPQYELLNMANYEPVPFKPDTYRVRVDLLDLLRDMGAIGFRLVSASGSWVFIKKMAKICEV